MSPDKIDLSGSLKGQVSVKPEEHPEDRTAPLRAERRGALIEDYKGIAVFAVLLVGMVAIGILSACEGFFDGHCVAGYQGRWSQTILAALMSGCQLRRGP
jgi:hypothetical protein